jgi:general transcription factor IIIA
MKVAQTSSDPQFKHYETNFTQSQVIKSHLNSLQDFRPHECEVCGIRFGGKQNLTRHLRIHTGEKPFDCSFCGRLFREKYHMENHEQRHIGDKAFECTRCEMKYVTKNALNIHVHRIHAPDRDHECGHCDKKYHYQGDLTQHLKRSHHIGKNSASSSSPTLVKSTVQESPVETEIPMDVEIPVESYKCGGCDEIFPTREKRREH